MKTRAAVLWEPKTPWSVEEVELDEPRAGEVLVRVLAAGICHSDDHSRSGDSPLNAPLIGGHEGAGVVEAAGPGVTRVAVGDRVVFTAIPSCGTCPSCAVGRHNLCDIVAYIGEGRQLSDHTARHHVRGQDAGIACFLGCFATRTVVHEWSCVKVDPAIPAEVACLVGCGVATGWGSVVYTGGAQYGDDVAVIGAGGLGTAAVQAARALGARNVFAIDPVPFKTGSAKRFGATHTAPTVDDAFDLVREVTCGRMCQVVVLTMGVGRGDLIGKALALAGKRGRLVVTNIHPAWETTVTVPLIELTTFEKQIVGSIFGSVNSQADIPRLLGEYQRGALDLAGMITRTYPLDGVNEAYDDLLAGKNIRGVLTMPE